MLKLPAVIALACAVFLAGCGSTPSSTGPSSQTPVVSTFGDARDGQTYTWVHIGTHDWMATNLRYFPPYTGASVYHDATVDSAASYQKWGVRYNWGALMGGHPEILATDRYPATREQGVCPTGWYVPTYSDWEDLWMQVTPTSWDSVFVPALMAKSEGGNDSYGFSAISGPFTFTPVHTLDTNFKAGDTAHLNINGVIKDSVLTAPLHWRYTVTVDSLGYYPVFAVGNRTIYDTTQFYQYSIKPEPPVSLLTANSYPARFSFATALSKGAYVRCVR